MAAGRVYGSKIGVIEGSVASLAARHPNKSTLFYHANRSLPAVAARETDARSAAARGA